MVETTAAKYNGLSHWAAIKIKAMFGLSYNLQPRNGAGAILQLPWFTRHSVTDRQLYSFLLYINCLLAEQGPTSKQSWVTVD